MVISVLLYGDLGRILLITQNKFSLPVLYKAGVHGESSFYITGYYVTVMWYYPQVPCAIMAT